MIEDEWFQVFLRDLYLNIMRKYLNKGFFIMFLHHFGDIANSNRFVPMNIFLILSCLFLLCVLSIRVATLSTLYLSVLGIIKPSLKSIGQF